MYLEREKDFIICQMKTAFQRFADSGPRDIRQKSQFDLVTEVDVAVEQYLTDAISREFPEDRIHAEEMASHETISGRTWTIDPIDGTCNMARNIPLYGVQVSLFQEGQPVLGAIYLPFWEQMLWAVRGEGCWCNGERIYVNRSISLNNAVISFGDYTHKSDAMALRQHKAVGYVYPRVAKLRMYGAACVDMALVAQGKLDATALTTTNVWDLAPGIALCREAGAIVTNLDGQPWKVGDAGVIVGATEQSSELMCRGFGLKG